MKKTIVTGIALLSLFTGINLGSVSTVNADTAENTAKTEHVSAIGSSVITNIQQGNVVDEDGCVQPRIGYRWHCNTCGYTSEWHAFANTAINNSNNHRLKNPGHDSYVYGV